MAQNTLGSMFFSKTLLSQCFVCGVTALCEERQSVTWSVTMRFNREENRCGWGGAHLGPQDLSVACRFHPGHPGRAAGGPGSPRPAQVLSVSRTIQGGA